MWLHAARRLIDYVVWPRTRRDYCTAWSWSESMAKGCGMGSYNRRQPCRVCGGKIRSAREMLTAAARSYLGRARELLLWRRPNGPWTSMSWPVRLMLFACLFCVIRFRIGSFSLSGCSQGVRDCVCCWIFRCFHALGLSPCRDFRPFFKCWFPLEPSILYFCEKIPFSHDWYTHNLIGPRRMGYNHALFLSIDSCYDTIAKHSFYIHHSNSKIRQWHGTMLNMTRDARVKCWSFVLSFLYIMYE